MINSSNSKIETFYIIVNHITTYQAISYILKSTINDSVFLRMEFFSQELPIMRNWHFHKYQKFKLVISTGKSQPLLAIVLTIAIFYVESHSLFTKMF